MDNLRHCGGAQRQKLSRQISKWIGFITKQEICQTCYQFKNGAYTSNAIFDVDHTCDAAVTIIEVNYVDTNLLGDAAATIIEVDYVDTNLLGDDKCTAGSRPLYTPCSGQKTAQEI